jgi:hypothetical protein
VEDLNEPITPANGETIMQETKKGHTVGVEVTTVPVIA